MSQPRVLCVCLTRDRPEMLMQAVRCFQRQSYTNRLLLIYDTGDRMDKDLQDGPWPWEDSSIFVLENSPIDHHGNPKTIGYLRNRANHHFNCDIIAHWDDDDWSHPRRLEEQVALLESSGADAVGYREMLFWRTPQFSQRFVNIGMSGGPEGPYQAILRHQIGEAWLYTGAICGTSLMYRREAWERNPFPPVPSGEDLEFLLRVGKVTGVPAFCPGCANPSGQPHEPRMIARIHGQANPAYQPEAMSAAPQHWKRVPEWDEYCSRMEAEA